MLCRVCGAQVPEGMLFCTSCGSPVNAGENQSPQQQGGGQVSGQVPVYAQQVPTYSAPVMGQYGNGQQSQQAAYTPAAPAAEKKSGSTKIVLVGMVSLLILAVLAVVVFGFSQGWFGGGDSETLRDDDSDRGTAATVPSGEGTKPSGEDTDPTADASKPTAPAEDPDGGYAGELRGKVYENAYFDFVFAPGKSWTFYSGKELATLNGISDYDDSQSISDCLNEELEYGAALTVMLANGKLGTNVNIIVQETPEELLGVDMDDFYEMLADSVQEQFDSAGLDTDVDLSTTTFLGKTTPAISIEVFGVCQKQVCLFRDEYYCIITAAATDYDEADELLSIFTEMNS